MIISVLKPACACTLISGKKKGGGKSLSMLFSSEVCGDLSPLPGFPFEYGGGIGVFAQPFLGTFYQLEKFFGLGVAGQFGLAFLLFHPVDGIGAVAVNGHIKASLLQQGKAMDNGKKLSDVIGRPAGGWRRAPPGIPLHRDFRCMRHLRQDCFRGLRSGREHLCRETVRVFCCRWMRYA